MDLERGGVDGTTDDLEPWLTAVRARLAPGELANLGTLQRAGDTPAVPGELLVRIMLADVDHYADLDSAVRDTPDMQRRRQALLGDLRRLRALIG